MIHLVFSVQLGTVMLPCVDRNFVVKSEILPLEQHLTHVIIVVIIDSGRSCELDKVDDDIL